jgi:hypothetical protein
LLAKTWHEARAGVRVKLLAEDSELYVYAESVDRVGKERAMRQRQMKWLWMRIPTHPGHLFQLDGGHRSDLMAATIPN